MFHGHTVSRDGTAVAFLEVLAWFLQGEGILPVPWPTYKLTQVIPTSPTSQFVLQHPLPITRRKQIATHRATLWRSGDELARCS